MKTNCLVVLCVLLLFSKGLNAQVNLSQGLVAYYPFSGNPNDASGSGNNGVLQNGVQLTNDRFGSPNSAYSFDGVDDYISIPYSSTLNFSSAFSVALYFN